MAGGTAVVALPAAGVRLYKMAGYKPSDVTLLQHTEQQLTATAVERSPAGALQLNFRLNISTWLHDATALPYFLWAYSAGEGLGYHSAAGAFRLDLQPQQQQQQRQQQQHRADSSSNSASTEGTASSGNSSTCELEPG